jgi:hypothetical protein
VGQVQENTENICNSMQQDKGHENMRSVSKRSATASAGGPALEVHLCLPAETKATNKKETINDRDSESSDMVP